MKKLLLCLLAFHFCSYSYAQQKAMKQQHNRIDDIETREQVEAFLKSIFKEPSHFEAANDSTVFYDNASQKLYDSLKPSPFLKADFDNNGYTDLLAIGKLNGDFTTICVLFFGRKKFTMYKFPFNSSSVDIAVPFVTYIDANAIIDLITLTQQHNLFYQDSSIVKINTTRLIYKFNDFIEFNPGFHPRYIQKIEYSTTQCFGECPVFSISIDSNRTAIYNAKMYNKQNGNFKGTIGKTAYHKLIDMVNYIDFTNLKDSYSIDWTDHQTCTITITYDDNKTKVISDYGLIGTYGLHRLYELLSALRNTQHWHRANN